MRTTLSLLPLLTLGLFPAACTTPETVLKTETVPGACAVALDPASLPPLPAGLPTYKHTGAAGGENTFSHGVASGDPTATDVILWTRVTTDAPAPATVAVFYEVALDEAFTSRVAAAEVTTDASVDHTVKIDVQGLTWGREYYYRFHALGRTSPAGKTKLAPAASEAACARFAVVSCSSYAHGYFYGYSHIAARKDLDAVLHLGDYIYEYGTNEYGDVRPYEPEHEIVTLQDYRTRYAQYRRDGALQALHQAHPMFATWDDHETADNSFADGASNHNLKDGDWNTRKAAARQAYFEWMPIRETFGRRVWRSFRYGDLADLTFLDTRIAGRDIQVGGPEDDAPERHILGDEQEKWLGEQLADASKGWEIIAQQVMVGQLLVNGTPFNMDQWDGYSSARERLFDLVEKHTAENLVVLTGDIHSSWVMELARDPFAEGYDRENENLGVEFVVPAISSPGLDPALEELIGKAIDESNPHLAYRNLSKRGYMLLDVSPERVQADYFMLDGVDIGQGNESFATAFTAKRGDARLTQVASPVERTARK